MHEITLVTSNRIRVGNSEFYDLNLGVLPGRVSTGAGGAQLEEQLSAKLMTV